MMSTTITKAQCVCSTIGFEQAIWLENYYPDLCPKAWRLAYFMNDFRAVYLPHRAWYQQTRRVEIIAEEIEGELDLIIEWPRLKSLTTIEAALDQLTPLKTNVTSVVLTPEDIPTTALSAAIKMIGKFYTVHLDGGRKPQNALIQLASQHKTNLIWYLEHGSMLSDFGEYQILRLPCLTLRKIKPILCQFKPFLQGNKRIGIFIEPSLHSAERATEVRSMIELMGMA